MGLDREFDSVRGNDRGADFRLGKMADDVEGLEVVAELLMLADRDGEEQAGQLHERRGDREDERPLKERAFAVGCFQNRYLLYILFYICNFISKSNSFLF